MKHTKIITAFVVFALLLGGTYLLATSMTPSQEQTQEQTEEVTIGSAVGDTAPAFFVEDIDGATHSLEGYEDSLVVLMATPVNCHYCIGEARDLVAVWETEQHREDIVFLTISMHPEDPLEEVLAFRNEHSINWPIIETQKGIEILAKYEMSTPATTVIINKNGVIIHRDEIVTTPNILRELIADNRS